jgi:glycerophosphoryl diester phosphodiesterase
MTPAATLTVTASSPAQRAMGRPLVFAHRGGRALGPENTIVAFDNGLAAGADGVELDVHLSSDGEVVVCHDATLDRTTDGTGPIAARTAADLARMNAGLRYGVDLEHEWTGARAGIPTLRDVLRRYHDAGVIIEIKAGTPAAARAVVDVIREAGAIDRVCVGSFSLVAVQAARAFEPRLATSASREEGQWALYRSWLGLSPGRVPYRALQVPEQAGRLRVVSPRFLRAVHRSGLALQVWTVNLEADMRRLFGWGVDGVITDCPDVAVRVRDGGDERRMTHEEPTNDESSERR